MRRLISTLVLSVLIQQPLFIRVVTSFTGTFWLKGESSELSGTTNGSTVTPFVNAGNTGTLVVNGGGSVDFASMVSGNGVRFNNGGQQNTNAAYYKFTGSTIGNIWNVEQGEVNFYLKSSYSWAEYQALPPNHLRYVYEVYDDSIRQFTFIVNIFPSSPNRLKVTWGQNGSGTEYDFPSGQEDTLFGSGVTLKVRVTWDGTNHSADQGISHLYLNDVLVQSWPYTYSAPNWGSSSIFLIGTQADPEGYFCLDNRLDEFKIGS